MAARLSVVFCVSYYGNCTCMVIVLPRSSRWDYPDHLAGVSELLWSIAQINSLANNVLAKYALHCDKDLSMDVKRNILEKTLNFVQKTGLLGQIKLLLDGSVIPKQKITQSRVTTHWRKSNLLPCGIVQHLKFRCSDKTAAKSAKIHALCWNNQTSQSLSHCKEIRGTCVKINL